MAAAIALALLSLFVTALAPASAAVIASDNAGNNPPYTGVGFNLVNADGGFGFGVWSQTGGTGTSTIAAGPVFQAQSSSGTHELFRTFDSALNVGDTFSTLLVFTDAVSTDEAAVLLFNASTQRFVVYWSGSSWHFTDSASFGVDTGVTDKTNLSFSFTRTDATTGYSMTLGGYSHSGTVAANAINEVGFRVDNAKTLQINNLQVVPEPSTYVMLVAGGVATLVYRRRRCMPCAA